MEISLMSHTRALRARSIVVNSNERGSALVNSRFLSYNLINMEDTTKILKSCIIARPGGVPQEELDDEFRKFTGMYIPYLSLGYSSLYEYLGTVKELIKKRNEKNQLVYTVIDPKTAHIAELVQNQKNYYPGFNYTRVYSRSKKNEGPSENFSSKRKATRQNGSNKRRKQDIFVKTRTLRKWNHIYDHDSSIEDGHMGGISDYDNWYDDEYNHPVEIKETPQNLKKVCEPIVNGKQLIGDDFFLQLAIRNIGMAVWRNGPCTALNSGLCKSGQTIKECTRTLQKVDVLTNKIVIMLGAEDIYRGHTSDQMIDDMEDLLEYLEVRFAFSRTAITLCTIPPMANLSMNCHRAQLGNLQRFNNWIREKTNYSFSESWNSGSHRYNLIDFHTKNTTVRGSTDYEYFQLDARMVSGTSHPYVLWSQRGRRLAMNLLRAGS